MNCERKRQSFFVNFQFLTAGIVQVILYVIPTFRKEYCLYLQGLGMNRQKIFSVQADKSEGKDHNRRNYESPVEGRRIIALVFL